MTADLPTPPPSLVDELRALLAAEADDYWFPRPFVESVVARITDLEAREAAIKALADRIGKLWTNNETIALIVGQLRAILDGEPS